MLPVHLLAMGRITFLHPDLGIGGAERLVVDAALALKGKGNNVNIVTTHHDKSHAFRETVNGEISVTVVGDWIPRNIFNRFYALMAYIRMIYAAVYVITSDLNPDVVVCDVVSVAVPVLKLKFSNVIFYCHFPDKLLSQPTGFLKAFYRAPLDWLEEYSMGKATRIFVNSRFTAGVFRNTFKRLNCELQILYPSLNMSFFDSSPEEAPLPASLQSVISEKTICFLSINRYERKKNLNLALEALNELRQIISENIWKSVHLILAGGYDTRVTENVEHLQELKKLSSDLNLTKNVSFLTSVSDIDKISLIKICICLVYTPSNEHFGIVPVEAMYMSKPVIAVNSGGPTESVLNEETGFLCEPTAVSFARAMKKFVLNKNLSSNFGAAGRKRVSSMFSFEEFSEKLHRTVCELMESKKDL